MPYYNYKKLLIEKVMENIRMFQKNQVLEL